MFGFPVLPRQSFLIGYVGGPIGTAELNIPMSGKSVLFTYLRFACGIVIFGSIIAMFAKDDRGHHFWKEPAMAATVAAILLSESYRFRFASARRAEKLAELAHSPLLQQQYNRLVIRRSAPLPQTQPAKY